MSASPASVGPQRAEPPAAPRVSRTRTSIHHPPPTGTGRWARWVPAVTALGVVFGDLGTSPLYTLAECLSGKHGVPPTDGNIYGILSLVFWSLMLVITLKYLVFLMRADNGGEGGIMALLALVPTNWRSPALGKVGLVGLLVIAGAALLFGDGVITPAVSVLSAIEGLGNVTSKLEKAVVPITAIILLAIFAVQSRGTAKIGRFFGPVMLLWFGTAGLLGLVHIVLRPGVLLAVSPHYAIRYFSAHGLHGIGILGGVILCVTGGEALYADMGHFGRKPIRDAWLYLCIPSLVLCYLGQGAVLLREPDQAVRVTLAAKPFYSMCPGGVFLYPFVFIAAAATVVASQALISGVFSLTYQAIQLGFFPRLTVKHTSRDVEGQIYLPLMNWGLAAACIALVFMFRESGKLAAAYGLAVSGTMAITSIVYFFVIRYAWRWPLWKAAGLVGFFLAFDIPFLVANVFKFLDGGYVPFLIGLLIALVMINWRIGRGLLQRHFQERSEPLDAFIASLDDRVVARTNGTAVFMASADGLPPSLRRSVIRFRTLHEKVVLLTVVVEHIPRVEATMRVQHIQTLGGGFHRLTLHYGFMEEPDVHGDLCLVLPNLGITSPADEILYVVGHETFIATSRGRMGAAAEGLFAFLSRNAKSATDYFQLPPDQVVEVGAHIDL